MEFEGIFMTGIPNKEKTGCICHSGVTFQYVSIKSCVDNSYSDNEIILLLTIVVQFWKRAYSPKKIFA